MLATIFNFWDDIWYNSGYLSLRVIPSPTQESSQNRIWSPLPSFQWNCLLTATMLLWWIINLKSYHQEEKIYLGGPSSKPLQPLYFEVSILLHRWSCCWNINHFHFIRRALLKAIQIGSVQGRFCKSALEVLENCSLNHSRVVYPSTLNVQPSQGIPSSAKDYNFVQIRGVAITLYDPLASRLLLFCTAKINIIYYE